MYARLLVQGWRRCSQLRFMGGIPSRDGSWLLSYRTSAIHYRCETSKPHRQNYGIFGLPEIGFVSSSCVKQGSRYAQVGAVHMVQGPKMDTGSTTLLRAFGLTQLRSSLKSERWIATKTDGSLKGATQNFAGWFVKSGQFRGSKGFSMSGFQQYQRRTLYGQSFTALAYL